MNAAHAPGEYASRRIGVVYRMDLVSPVNRLVHPHTWMW